MQQLYAPYWRSVASRARQRDMMLRHGGGLKSNIAEALGQNNCGSLSTELKALFRIPLVFEYRNKLRKAIHNAGQNARRPAVCVYLHQRHTSGFVFVFINYHSFCLYRFVTYCRVLSVNANYLLSPIRYDHYITIVLYYIILVPVLF